MQFVAAEDSYETEDVNAYETDETDAIDAYHQEVKEGVESIARSEGKMIHFEAEADAPNPPTGVSRVWCEGCQDHFPIKHYDEESGDHLLGNAYGRLGDLLAKERELEIMSAKEEARELTKDWVELAPAVRVLLQMPEEDALWLRSEVAQARAANSQNKPKIWVARGGSAVEGKWLEMHVLEVLLYG